MILSKRVWLFLVHFSEHFRFYFIFFVFKNINSIFYSKNSMEELNKQIINPRGKYLQNPLNAELTNDMQIDIEALISQLKDYGQIEKPMLLYFLNRCQKKLQNQPNILRLPSPIRIVGDIHGQFYDLVHILESFGNAAEEKYLFLGDYVDRGQFCIEVMTLLVALKCKYPWNIYLLRGNHQSKTMTEHFNFKLECVKKYDIEIYERFLEAFCKLPLCALIDNKYFCVHGGISPQLKKIKDLEKVNRFKEIQQSGLICDLLWSDPVNSNNNLWEKNKVRSCSYVFSKRQAEKFLKQNKVEMIIRGHEVQTKGFAYQMSEIRKKLTLTIFSAPNYCGTYKNKGGIAIIKSNTINIESFGQTPSPFVFSNYMNVLQWSIPIIATKTSKIFLHLLKAMETIKTCKFISEEDQKKFVEQMQVINKLECLSDLLENKKTQNFQMLLNFNTKQGDQNKENYSDSESILSMKFLNDQCQRYPHLPPPVIGPKLNSSHKVCSFEKKDEEQILPLTQEQLNF